MSDLVSKPYKPNPQRCCEACTFATGDHADFCEKFKGPNLRSIDRQTADDAIERWKNERRTIDEITAAWRNLGRQN